MSLIGSFPFYCIIRICEDLNICTLFHIFTFDIVVLYDKLFFFFSYSAICLYDFGEDLYCNFECRWTLLL